MTKPFKHLVQKMSLKAQGQIAEKTSAIVNAMPQQELRQARHLSQERLAKVLYTKQANISQIERRTDMYISTLRSYIKAMGGELDIVARFPEGDVHINQFKDIEHRLS